MEKLILLGEMIDRLFNFFLVWLLLMIVIDIESCKIVMVCLVSVLVFYIVICLYLSLFVYCVNLDKCCSNIVDVYGCVC